MLTRLYIEALLVDEEVADQVWEAWDKGKFDDQIACIAWMLIVERPLCPPEADIQLILVKGSANDPKRSFLRSKFIW